MQLSSQDPLALSNWLVMNGYDIPSSVAPVIDQYVVEGYDFLAIKLIPGAGIDAMRPVRITTTGFIGGLPLRMAAAGMVATLPVRLFVVSDVREEPTNAPTASIDPGNLIWNWDTGKSNYDVLRQSALSFLGGAGWLVEQAEPFAATDFQSLLLGLAMSQPAQSGWGDMSGMGAPAECQADLDAIFGPLHPGPIWVTRLYSELSLTALSSDLTVGTATNPNPVPRQVTVNPGATQGTPPQCPPDPCGTGGGAGTMSSGSTMSASSVGGAGGMGGTMPAGSAGMGGTMPAGSGGMGGAMPASGSGGMGGAMPASGAGGSGMVCIPGRQIECFCPGGVLGAQACLPDGSGYGICQGCDGDSGGTATPAEHAGGCGCEAAGAAQSPVTLVWGLLALVAAAAFRSRRSGG